MNILQTRRDKAQARLKNLQTQLTVANKLAKGKACVYATGSFGRGEAGKYSDLDLFIVGREQNDDRALTKLDEILVKSELIRATRKLKFPEFSGDGQYLEHFTVKQLVSTLGKPDDDANNTFTARVLLLLESRPLLETQIYQQTLREVISEYWKDYEGHKNEFVPAFLVNDILRLWRTFCVNYEAFTQVDSPEKKAKRKLKNYKLKHSRLLTCCSGLIYLMAVMEEKTTVSIEDAMAMTSFSPLERLAWLQKRRRFKKFDKEISQIIDLYAGFLEKTNVPELELISLFSDPSRSQEAFNNTRQFGDQVFRLVSKMGRENTVFRYMVI